MTRPVDDGRHADAPVSVDPDTVTLKRMTEVEWNERFDLVPSTGFRPNYSVGAHFVLRELGLIRDETPLERFARETNTTITDDNRAAIEAALKWGAKS